MVLNQFHFSNLILFLFFLCEKLFVDPLGGNGLLRLVLLLGDMVSFIVGIGVGAVLDVVTVDVIHASGFAHQEDLEWIFSMSIRTMFGKSNQGYIIKFKNIF